MPNPVIADDEILGIPLMSPGPGAEPGTVATSTESLSVRSMMSA